MPGQRTVCSGKRGISIDLPFAVGCECRPGPATGSPRLADALALNLKVLDDDRNFFPKYNVSLVLTREIAKEYPQIADLVAPVAEKLTDKVLLQLNAQIDVEGREPADVAWEWLKKEGFVTDK